MNIKDILLWAQKTLEDHQSPSARLDAEVLLSHVLGFPRAYLRAYPEKRLNYIENRRYAEIIARRMQGEPVAYLIGTQEFWSLRLRVTQDTLIPRAETEQLVEHVLALGGTVPSLSVLELGTGSGAIALALATERPGWNISATDISDAALSIARENAIQLGVEGIRWLRGRWFDALPIAEQFDIIVSNPPYISEGDEALESGVRTYEPTGALIAEENGFADLFEIIEQAKKHLSSEGLLLLEHGYQQQQTLIHFMQQKGYQNIRGYKDLSGHDRIVKGCFVHE